MCAIRVVYYDGRQYYILDHMDCVRLRSLYDMIYGSIQSWLSGNGVLASSLVLKRQDWGIGPGSKCAEAWAHFPCVSNRTYMDQHSMIQYTCTRLQECAYTMT